MDTWPLPDPPAWPEPAPWIALRLDWSRQRACCWMIPPEDALAAWSAIPELLRPPTPAAFAASVAAGVQGALRAAGAALDGFDAISFAGSELSADGSAALAMIERGPLTPLEFRSEDCARLVGALVARSFPRAAAFGPYHPSEDRNGCVPENHWAGRASEARALVEALDLRRGIADSPRRSAPSL